MKFYYICPRCGRIWRKFIPRSKMKCRFCGQTWHTKGRSGTKKRFSFSATLMWLCWAAIVAYVIAHYAFGYTFTKELSVKVRTPDAAQVEDDAEVAPEPQVVEDVSENAENADAEGDAENAEGIELAPEVLDSEE